MLRDNGGIVRKLWFEEALLAEGWARNVRLTVANGHITAIECNVPHAGGETAYGIALPGLFNVHSHAFQRGMAGLAEHRGPANDDFWSWREIMYRFLDRLTPDDIEAIAALAFAEMLETGFTRVGEFHYLHNDPDGRPYTDRGELSERMVSAAATAGIGLTLLPVFYAHSGFGGLAPSVGQRRFITDIESFAELLARARVAARTLPDPNVGIAPHSLRAVTPGELAAMLPLAEGGPIHIHAAEQVKEVNDCLAWSGQRPVAWLLDHMPVDGNWCLIHATHLDAAEVDRLARSGAVAGLCPITEANLGDGIFPARDFLARGGRLGVGTDSNIFIDAAGELRGVEYAQRLSLRARNVLAAQEGNFVGASLFEAALSGGAQALGVHSAVLAIGAAADIVVLDAQHPSLIGRHGDAIVDSFIFAGRGPVVSDVWRRGEQVVREGRHIRHDAIAARYRSTIRKLLS